MTRNSNVSRKTSETEIDIKMNLDGTGNYNISLVKHSVKLLAIKKESKEWHMPLFLWMNL